MSSWPELFTCSSPFIRRQGCRGHAQLLSAFLQCVKLMLIVPQLSFQNTQASAPDNCRIQHLLNLAMGVSPSNIMHNHRRLLCSDNIALKLASQLLHLHLSLPRLHLPSHARTEFPGPFDGMLLISPWLEYNADAPSFSPGTSYY
jgi:hypothetical protein